MVGGRLVVWWKGTTGVRGDFWLEVVVRGKCMVLTTVVYKLLIWVVCGHDLKSEHS